MPTPITSASPALSYLVAQHGASSVYVQKIISVVNASPYLNELFNDFEGRTLPNGSKPQIANTGTAGDIFDPGPALPDTNATDGRILISDPYFGSYEEPRVQRAWELNLTKDLAHELQHSNSWANRRAAEAAERTRSDTATALSTRVAGMRTDDEIASKVAEYNALKARGDVTSDEIKDRLKNERSDRSVADFATPILHAAADPANLDANGNLMVTPALRQARKQSTHTVTLPSARALVREGVLSREGGLEGGSGTQRTQVQVSRNGLKTTKASAASWNTCSARYRRWRPRRGSSGDCYGNNSKQRPFDAGYEAKRL